MDGARLITRLRLRNLLSFGPEGDEIGLEPLNVLIGPNASGKSNVIEAISLLQAAPRDLQAPIRAGGGVNEWLWKGGERDPTAETDAVVECLPGKMPLCHRLAFTRDGQRFAVVDEVIEDEMPWPGRDAPLRHYEYGDGGAVLNAESPEGHVTQRILASSDLNAGQSVLSQVKDARQYSQITLLGRAFEGIRIYGQWHLGRGGEPRRPQLPDLPGDFLMESAQNLALVVSNLQNRTGVEELLNEHLRRFYPRAEKLTVRIDGGTVQLQLLEKGLRLPIPATRLSDGTLRYLCLLSVLLHPEPPPLACIEEPELGLHPDIMPTLAELLQDASQRMQLIVTTHSESLVSALSGVPEAVAVCERGEGGTVIRRLEEEALREWLERYTLGDLWAMGELGGNP